MSTGILICLLLTVLLTTGFLEAQEPGKIPRIGYLTGTPLSADTAWREALRQGLRDLGYVEGKNIVIEWRSWEGKLDRRPALAAELARLKVDGIVAVGPGDTRAAREATATIPIVTVLAGDPGYGFVASLARPGGNVTGLSTLSADLSGKRLELLKEIVLKLSRVAVFASSASPTYTRDLKEVELAAGALGVKLQNLDILSPKDVETAFQAAVNGRADAVLVIGASPLFRSQPTPALAVKSRLPTIYDQREFVEAGGLMSYDASVTDLYRRAATYVDKILRGAKPADLPVEQPKKFELVINLKTANQIGLTIPPNVLARADRVIR
jgi:putative ABC transport system substrate-binding protein